MILIPAVLDFWYRMVVPEAEYVERGRFSGF